ncbi:arabinan endo-1,5-alpha-L-arabinosidase [Paenibacillus amylolyticus]|uniref:arabinan endo-1,5-alpha-L-arabinosidase n=1 Tax=Paenibacillus TaxID=44249 RepID=UPI00096C903D|nr:arabinan endo-1,5-alpha-L-arabinosidase [Paenibacillus amylolyticus]OME97731.1 arabinan endo-1,5-alpha-L-arabinosidase [Paenibacillus amylolyticus]OMF10552.1 arabinan endo-1,5-alpha-L-arabinosidase [Paenibacillus amylolyticus]
MLLLLVVGAAGCSGEGAGETVSRPVFPEAPQDAQLYDTSILDDESRWTVNNAHDPAIIKTDQGYYVYSTDVRVAGEAKPGVMVRKSDDLIHWKWVGQALPGIPQEALDWTGAVNLWAPDVVQAGDTYRMYYSASSFGSTQSAIGLQTSSSPEGPWTDEGLVVQTSANEQDKLNAIDANPIVDAEGNSWMAYGSFFDGIYIAPLDPDTGKFKGDGYGTRIAARDRATEEGAVEGPYIVFNPEFKKYYLFVSYDSLFEDYNVRVARADSITGPYTDMNGMNMLDTDHLPQYEIGTKILGGYRFTEGEGWVAPGHNSILKDGDDYYIVHHARGETDKNWPYLHVRKMLWTKDGWPVVSPERYAGEAAQDIPKSMIAGEWEGMALDPSVDGQIQAVPYTLTSNGKIKSEKGSGTWTFDDKQTLTLKWKESPWGGASIEELKLLPSWDWERSQPALVVTGLDDHGVAVWGKQISAAEE